MIARLHREASAELEKQAAWYEQRRAGLSSDLLDDVRQALDAIAAHPSGWPLSTLPRARRAGVRRFPLQRFPLTVEYVVEDGSVFIVALAHMSRTPGYWLRRLRLR